MHILIIEAALTGHHSGYLERIAAGYIAAGHVVTVTVLQCNAAHPAIERLKAQFGAEFEVLSLNDAIYEAASNTRMGEPGRELALRRMFGRAYRAVHQLRSVDYVFLPYLDYCLYAFGLLGSPFGHTQWGGICMRPSFHYGKYGVIAPRTKFANIKRTLFIKLLQNKTLKFIFTIDELLHRYITEQYPQWSHHLQYLPDPAELKGSHSYESGRQMLGMDEGAIVILVYGAIDGRKGLDVLIEAMTRPDIPKTLHLLVVGRQSVAIQTLMQSIQVSTLRQEGRFHVINNFVDNKVEQIAFAASDIVWLGYRNHYTMSGVLVLAAISATPVIATCTGLIGWYTRKAGLGLVVDATDANLVKNALINLCGQLNSVIDNEKSKNIGVLHSWSYALRKINSD